MNDTCLHLVACFTTVFPGLSEAAVPAAEMASVEGWDSLATMKLITVVEEEFGVSVGPSDVEHFGSFRQVLQYLQGRAGHALAFTLPVRSLS